MNITLNKNDEIVMKLLHYFITVEGYNPVVLHGAKDEIWLENANAEYKIIRIVSNYIHNNEQLDFDVFKTKQILKKIKGKMFSLKMNSLSIFVNLGENVDINKKTFDNIKLARLDNLNDVKNYSFIMSNFPNILEVEATNDEGVELFIKLTEDINKKNFEETKKAEDVFSKKKPVMTYIFIGVCILSYILSAILSNNIFQIDPNVLDNIGGLVNKNYINSNIELIGRLFSSMFLHAGILHLACNMYSLYIIGPQLESFFGKLKFSIIYIISGLVSGIFSVLSLPQGYVSVGASGAIFGLLGSLLYFGYHYRVYLSGVIKSQIIPLIILNIGIGFVIPGIDYMAHLGGLIGGVLITKAVGVKYKSTLFDKINGIIMCLILIVSLLLFYYKG